MNLKQNKPLLLNLIFTLILSINLVYDYIINNGVNSFRIVLAGVTVWFFYLVCQFTFFKRSNIGYYSVFIFIVFSIYFGSVFNFYEKIKYYDKILHLLSGVIIALVGYIFFLSLIRNAKEDGFNPMLGIIFSIMFAISAAGVWEIWEFSTDQLFGFVSQNNSLIDTMWDIICGTVMGIITNIPIYMHIKGFKVRFIQVMIDEMENKK